MLIFWKSILKCLNNLLKEYVNNNLMKNDNCIYIESNININIKLIFNSNKNMTSNNIYEKNFEINIKDLF